MWWYHELVIKALPLPNLQHPWGTMDAFASTSTYCLLLTRRSSYLRGKLKYHTIVGCSWHILVLWGCYHIIVLSLPSSQQPWDIMNGLTSTSIHSLLLMRGSSDLHDSLKCHLITDWLLHIKTWLRHILVLLEYRGIFMIYLPSPQQPWGTMGGLASTSAQQTVCYLQYDH